MSTPPTTLPLAGPVAYVPCCRVGLGTGTACVKDVLTRLPVRLSAPDLCLVGGVVCVKGPVVRWLGGRALVRFGAVAAWVRPVALPAVLSAPKAAG